MEDAASFKSGYVEGWRTMMGENAAVPPCRVSEVTPGVSAFQQGINQALADVVTFYIEGPARAAVA